ncbi:hypothetical protein ARALYDRAFT_909524 [Arabidopsis lyrata subsp. lyrata]|uniref:TPX2 C-terminal domain-containing protein n=1 Tax=Arabidopsis lyrata subsp. lyrata TaxID=81972 RepID=D7M7D3_ARALL|nr:hypothetical protein ARALYDRAFT_909524 [Arabidopsis lyrata subsp. lyrata]
MESWTLKNGKPVTPVKDRSKFQSKVQENSRSSENANPNISHASPAKSPITKSAKKSAQKNQSPNPKKPSQAVSSPRNRIRERKFVVVAKKNSRKGKKDPAVTESKVAEIDCKCGERKKGNMKCVCVAYETLRASQEEFFKNRIQSEEEKGDLEECCNLGQNVGDGGGSGEPEKTGASTMKRSRAKVVEEARQSVAVSAKNLGLDPNASISSSWDSTRGSAMSGSSNTGRRSRRNSMDSSTTMGSRRSKKKQVKVTSLKPFKLRTEQRGKMKEEEFAKKIHEITLEEEKLRIPIAQGLPWTTDEPECLVKPHWKDITRPVDLTLHSDVRAVERAEFDYQVAEKMNFIEQYKMERERQQKLAEEEEIKRLRKELVPKAQPMPYFDRPFIPRRSSKHSTAPQDPKFHIPQHKKIRCCSSSSWSEAGSCMSDFQYQFL